MRKQLFILAIFIVFLNSFLHSQNSFSAKLNFPSVITQGESATIRLDIYKPKGLRNYTVFTQKLPPGFYVKAIDLKGASMTYENNELVFTWLRISEDAKLSVTYEISTMVGLSGKYNISGNLSYMVEGKLGQFDLHDYFLKVNKKTDNKIISDIKNDKTDIPKLKNSNEDIKCSRTIVYNKRKKVYEVEIRFKKKENCSYLIVEKFPKEFKFSETESLGAEVLVNKSLVQYYWKNLRGSKEYILNYQLESTRSSGGELSTSQESKPQISGKLSMLKDGQIYNINLYTVE